jgi:hypothetical protein
VWPNDRLHFIGQNRVAAKALPTFDGWIAAMRKIKNENPGTLSCSSATASPPGLPLSTRRSSTSSKQKRFCASMKAPPDRRRLIATEWQYDGL